MANNRIGTVILRLLRSSTAAASPVRSTISPITFAVRVGTLYNRLLYRSKQRGFLELDLVLGNWVEENIRSLDESGIKSLVHVLDLENPDLWKWLTGQEQPPEEVKANPVFLEVQKKVLKNLDSYAAPETRSIPGQPWVRGWDDNKKGRDSPITGNQ